MTPTAVPLMAAMTSPPTGTQIATTGANDIVPRLATQPPMQSPAVLMLLHVGLLYPQSCAEGMLRAASRF